MKGWIVGFIPLHTKNKLGVSENTDLREDQLLQHEYRVKAFVQQASVLTLYPAFY